jgi:hypothetical protein
VSDRYVTGAVEAQRCCRRTEIVSVPARPAQWAFAPATMCAARRFEPADHAGPRILKGARLTFEALPAASRAVAFRR